MKIVGRVLLGLVGAVIGAAGYLLVYGNASSALRNGCYASYTGLQRVDGEPRFQGFPPRFVCLYRAKDGRVVERPN